MGVRGLSGVGLFLLLASMVVAPAARATTVQPLNLEQMTARAATIFSGRCTAIRPIHDQALGGNVIEVTFRVDRALKGAPAASHRIRILDESDLTGSLGSGGWTRPFRPGEEVVLFLYGENDLGLTSPVGMGQGRLGVTRDKSGGRVATSVLGNESLWRGVSTDAAARMRAHGLSRSRGQAVRLDSLLDAIAELAR